MKLGRPTTDKEVRDAMIGDPCFESPARKGRYNELIAAAYLMRRGMSVYLPYTGKGVDIIAVDGRDRIFRFEVRSAFEYESSKNSSGYQVPTKTKDTNRVDYYIGVIDNSRCIIFDKDRNLIRNM